MYFSASRVIVAAHSYCVHTSQLPSTLTSSAITSAQLVFPCVATKTSRLLFLCVVDLHGAVTCAACTVSTARHRGCTLSSAITRRTALLCDPLCYNETARLLFLCVVDLHGAVTSASLHARCELRDVVANLSQSSSSPASSSCPASCSACTALVDTISSRWRWLSVTSSSRASLPSPSPSP